MSQEKNKNKKKNSTLPKTMPQAAGKKAVIHSMRGLLVKATEIVRGLIKLSIFLSQ